MSLIQLVKTLSRSPQLVIFGTIMILALIGIVIAALLDRKIPKISEWVDKFVDFLIYLVK